MGLAVGRLDFAVIEAEQVLEDPLLRLMGSPTERHTPNESAREVPQHAAYADTYRACHRRDYRMGDAPDAGSELALGLCLLFLAGRGALIGVALPFVVLGLSLGGRGRLDGVAHPSALVLGLSLRLSFFWRGRLDGVTDPLIFTRS
jgi:hypothetical protein